MPSTESTRDVGRLVGYGVLLALGILTLVYGVQAFIRYQAGVVLWGWGGTPVVVLFVTSVGTTLVLASLVGTTSLALRRGLDS